MVCLWSGEIEAVGQSIDVFRSTAGNIVMIA